jgi:hypothetical protein
VWPCASQAFFDEREENKIQFQFLKLIKLKKNVSIPNSPNN